MEARKKRCGTKEGERDSTTKQVMCMLAYTQSNGINRRLGVASSLPLPFFLDV
jgi:hypothetical protein